MSSIRTLHTSVRIKMCGMTHRQDIQQAIDLGVNALGVIFYEKSVRYQSMMQAKALLDGLPPFVDVVAVLVNPEPLFVHQLIQDLPIQCLQFHGDESPQFCDQFGFPYVKALPATSTEEIMLFEKKYSNAQALLLDTPSSHRGGSGLTFDWQMIPKMLTKPLILAGGLHVKNVREAISTCAPYAVDVCSGIEASDGIKDHDKMKQFVESVWGYNDSRYSSR